MAGVPVDFGALVAGEGEVGEGGEIFGIEAGVQSGGRGGW